MAFCRDLVRAYLSSVSYLLRNRVIISINSPFRIGSELMLMDDDGPNGTEANQYIAPGALRKPGRD